MSSSAARYFPGAFGKGITSRQADAQNPQASPAETGRAGALGQPSSTASATSAATDVVDSRAALSDEALMARICEGDKEALAYMFRRYTRRPGAVLDSPNGLPSRYLPAPLFDFALLLHTA